MQCLVSVFEQSLRSSSAVVTVVHVPGALSAQRECSWSRLEHRVKGDYHRRELCVIRGGGGGGHFVSVLLAQ